MTLSSKPCLISFAPIMIALAEDEQAAQAAGFDAHLVKPADMTRLRALLREGAENRP